MKTNALNINELEINKAKEAHFANFIKTFASQDKDIEVFADTFINWYLTHENELKLIYAKECPGHKANLRNWARLKFYNWTFNQYLKDLFKEIEMLTVIQVEKK